VVEVVLVLRLGLALTWKTSLLVVVLLSGSNRCLIGVGALMLTTSTAPRVREFADSFRRTKV